MNIRGIIPTIDAGIEFRSARVIPRNKISPKRYDKAPIKIERETAKALQI